MFTFRIIYIFLCHWSALLAIFSNTAVNFEDYIWRVLFYYSHLLDDLRVLKDFGF